MRIPITALISSILLTMLLNARLAVAVCAITPVNGVVTIPNDDESILENAFSGCTDLKRIEIPTSVTSIGNTAFFGCSSLASVVIPDSVTSIGNATFQGCSSLTSVSLGKALVSLGRDAFKGCSSLSSLRVESAIVERDCPNDKRDTDSFVSRYFPDQKKDRLEGAFEQRELILGFLGRVLGLFCDAVGSAAA